MATKATITGMLKERAKRYGLFADHAACSQALKGVLRSHMGATKWNGMSAAQQESLEMICHKLARIANGDPDYDDNWCDVAGYATLVIDEN